MFNTFKSFVRFYKSVFGKYSPINPKDNSIERVVNYSRCDDNFSSSGQPTEHQLSLIKKAGFAVVINLAPNDLLENPLKNEAAVVTKLGMKYVHIPVKMLKPTQADFDAFVAAMKNASGEKIWVHCAIGLRASAFLFKFRCSILGEEKQTAIWDLREIWEPFGAWKAFVYSDKAASL